MDICEGSIMTVNTQLIQLNTLLGPQGLDKMLKYEKGEVLLTNNGATILRLLSLEYQRVKILGYLAKIQDNKVGDGTTSVVIYW